MCNITLRNKKFKILIIVIVITQRVNIKFYLIYAKLIVEIYTLQFLLNKNENFGSFKKYTK